MYRWCLLKTTFSPLHIFRFTSKIQVYCKRDNAINKIVNVSFMWNFLWSPSWIGLCLTNDSRPVCIVVIPFCLAYDINTAMCKCNCLPFRSTSVDFRFWLGQYCLPLVLCGCSRRLFHYCSFIYMLYYHLVSLLAKF
jgi:hypothetical protein